MVAHHFNRVLGVDAAARGHGRVVGGAFENEHFGVFAGLDAFQGIAHGIFGGGGYHFGAGHVFAVFGIVGDGVIHVGNAAFIHQIHNQFQFVQALEISHFGGVAGFYQGFKAAFHELHRAAAQHGLLAEKVGFGFFAEVGFNHAAFGAAVGRGIREGDVAGFAGFILVNRNQGGHAAAFFVFAAHGVAGAFGGNHNHIEVGAGHDLVVVHVEAVGKSQHGAFFKVGFDFVFIHLRLVFIGQQNHHHIGRFGGFGHAEHFVAGGFGFFP